jgi:hypothetical protein
MPMNPRLLRPLDTGFNPRKISSLGLWLDASAPSPVTIETGVAVWRDLSGNNRNATQNVGNNQPDYTLNAVNGRPALTFNGSSHSLRSTLALGSTHSVFAVVNMDERKIAGIIGGSVSSDLIYGDGSSSFSGGNYGAFGVARAVYGGGAITTGVYQVVSAVLAGGTLPTNLSMWTNGTGGPVSVVTAGTAANAKLDANVFIGSSAGSHFMKGKMAELICYTKALTTAERVTVQKYLGKKYNIAVA